MYIACKGFQRRIRFCCPDSRYTTRFDTGTNVFQIWRHDDQSFDRLLHLSRRWNNYRCQFIVPCYLLLWKVSDYDFFLLGLKNCYYLLLRCQNSWNSKCFGDGLKVWSTPKNYLFQRDTFTIRHTQFQWKRRKINFCKTRHPSDYPHSPDVVQCSCSECTGWGIWFRRQQRWMEEVVCSEYLRWLLQQQYRSNPGRPHRWRLGPEWAARYLATGKSKFIVISHLSGDGKDFW